MLEKFPTSAGYRAGILLIYVCFVAIYWVTPLYGDDLCFIKDYAAHTGSSQLTFRGVCDFFVYNWHTENGRLPNLLFVTPFVMAFGRYAGAFILAIFATGMVAETALLSARIAGKAARIGCTSRLRVGGIDRHHFLVQQLFPCLAHIELYTTHLDDALVRTACDTDV